MLQNKRILRDEIAEFMGFLNFSRSQKEHFFTILCSRTDSIGKSILLAAEKIYQLIIKRRAYLTKLDSNPRTLSLKKFTASKLIAFVHVQKLNIANELKESHNELITVYTTCKWKTRAKKKHSRINGSCHFSSLFSIHFGSFAWNVYFFLCSRKARWRNRKLKCWKKK